jgi:hypothetical protein
VSHGGGGEGWPRCTTIIVGIPRAESKCARCG